MHGYILFAQSLTVCFAICLKKRSPSTSLWGVLVYPASRSTGCKLCCGLPRSRVPSRLVQNELAISPDLTMADMTATRTVAGPKLSIFLLCS